MTALTAAAIGCASPGPPRPPSLNLPNIVKDLHADRAGDIVRLTFTAPTRTSDRLQYKGPIIAELCRQLAAGPCTPVTRKTIAAGAVTPLEDRLPSQLTAGPDALLTYRVQLFNAKNKTAGPSDPAYVAAGPAPTPIANLTATASAQGAILRWQLSPAASTVELERLRTSTLKNESTDASPQKATEKTPAKAASFTKKAAPPPTPRPAPAKTNPFQSESEPAQVNLRAGSTDAGGTIDTTAQFGQSYTYTATRVRTLILAGHALEIRSAPSAAAIEMRDTFPPAVPQGLTAVPVAAGIDLSWEPDTESDLAGYIVYRTTPSANASATTPPTRLNPQPLPSPAFHDAATQPGRTYRYSVTAIDTTGNESAPSAAVEETPDTP